MLVYKKLKHEIIQKYYSAVYNKKLFRYNLKFFKV